ncbi:MAG: tRNA pseudouridine(55) synthase TruB [Chloroflexota bacterium]|nr:tRNA pseudouridine(55) synthase TruB [Chloroflexota bacterium]
MDAASHSGFIIVNKPAGVTSFSMVSLVRRLTGVRRVGHAGTLDPLASGVLPVAVGHATRLIEYLDDVAKTYVARVRFGIATDTYDAEGKPTSVIDASHLTREAVESELSGFVGDIEQMPPLYSALKIAGKPLYRYAREGADVAIAWRVVRVERIELGSFADGVAEIEVRCGKGTYIRSLAHDLGVRLGCGGHLDGLVRTSTGGFGIEAAHTPDELIAAAAGGRLKDFMLAPDRAVERRPAVILEHEHSVDVRTGREVRFESRGGDDVCRAYSVEGAFLGVLKHRSGAVWRPEKVWPGA